MFLSFFDLHTPTDTSIMHIVVTLNLLILMISILNVDSQPVSQIEQICSTIEKRFAVPFPDMHRFLSTSHRVDKHGRQTHHEHGSKKQDCHACLCSLNKDSEEMSNFINIFIGEHGQAPAFNIFESCEQISKRENVNQVCSDRLNKRWKSSVEGPMAIDFINQMLEARKVQSYPYSSEIDPYLV